MSIISIEIWCAGFRHSENEGELTAKALYIGTDSISLA